MSWIFLAAGALFVALGIPMMRRQVRPNPWYGLRVPATLADEDVWFAANAKSGRDLVVVGVLQMLAAITPLVVPLDRNAYLWLNIGVMAIGTLASSVIGWVRANRLLRERKQTR